jgi:hypothetical protein
MNRAEDMLRQNESAEQEPDNESCPLEHIYIPGIGVRDALGSDSAESPDFWRKFREEYARRATLVSCFAIWSFANASRVVSSLSAQVMSVRTKFEAALTPRPNFSGRLRESAHQYRRRVQSSVTSSIQSVGSRLREIPKYRLPSTAPLVRSTAMILHGAQSRLLCGGRKIRGAIDSRLSLPALLTESKNRHLRKAHSFLRSAAVSARNLLQATDRYRVSVRFSDNYTADLTRLRRAVPALAALLVMIVFVIQALISVTAR